MSASFEGKLNYSAPKSILCGRSYYAFGCLCSNVVIYASFLQIMPSKDPACRGLLWVIENVPNYDPHVVFFNVDTKRSHSSAFAPAPELTTCVRGNALQSQLSCGCCVLRRFIVIVSTSLW